MEVYQKQNFQKCRKLDFTVDSFFCNLIREQVGQRKKRKMERLQSLHSQVNAPAKKDNNDLTDVSKFFHKERVRDVEPFTPKLLNQNSSHDSILLTKSRVRATSPSSLNRPPTLLKRHSVQKQKLRQVDSMFSFDERRHSDTKSNHCEVAQSAANMNITKFLVSPKSTTGFRQRPQTAKNNSKPAPPAFINSGIGTVTGGASSSK
jgi:hypothetical protein